MQALSSCPHLKSLSTPATGLPCPGGDHTLWLFHSTPRSQSVLVTHPQVTVWWLPTVTWSPKGWAGRGAGMPQRPQAWSCFQSWSVAGTGHWCCWASFESSWHPVGSVGAQMIWNQRIRLLPSTDAGRRKLKLWCHKGESLMHWMLNLTLIFCVLETLPQFDATPRAFWVTLQLLVLKS